MDLGSMLTDAETGVDSTPGFTARFYFATCSLV